MGEARIFLLCFLNSSSQVKQQMVVKIPEMHLLAIIIPLKHTKACPDTTVITIVPDVTFVYVLCHVLPLM